MNAYPAAVQRGIEWTSQDTGLRAYHRAHAQKICDYQQPVKNEIPIADLDARFAESVAQQGGISDEIKRKFVLRNERAVMSFLGAHRTIPGMLLDAIPELDKEFGQNTVYALKVITEDDDFRELYVVAEWSGAAQDAVSALDKFIEKWWIERSAASFGRVHFTYDLR